MGLSNYNGFTGKQREASLRRVHKLWDSGEVPRPAKCDACFQTEGAIHGHSEDYSNDDVHIPICITCHLILHTRFQQPQLWDLYKKAVRYGFRGVPLEQRNALYRIKQIYDVDDPASFPGEYVNERRSATVLDMIAPVKFHHPNATEPAPHPTCPLAHDVCPWTLSDPVPDRVRKAFG
jgi:hypothetical protein